MCGNLLNEKTHKSPGCESGGTGLLGETGENERAVPNRVAKDEFFHE